jgi:serine/threonine protein kinase
VDMNLRRANPPRERRCPTCGITKMSALGARCADDGAVLVAPYAVEQVLVSGRFRLIEELGEGAFARVFIAADREHEGTAQELVAFKRLRGKMRNHPEAIARFDREAKLLAQLQGVPGVVRFVARGVSDSREPYIAIEYLDGLTLQEVLRGNGRDLRGYGHLPPRVAFQIALSVLRPLEAIHRFEIVHRDLKPSNIILMSDSDLRLLDFGVARAPGHVDEQLTQENHTVGTPLYMSPELCRNSRVDQRSDLYAVGIILYCMLTGTPPFTGDPVQIIRHHEMTPVPVIPSGGEITEQMSRLVERAMSKSPDDRPPTARAMYDEIAAMLGAQPFAASQPGVSGDETAQDLKLAPAAWVEVPSDGTRSVRAVEPRSDPMPVPVLRVDPPLMTPRQVRRGVIAAVVAGLLGVMLAALVGGAGDLGDANASSDPQVIPATPVEPAKMARTEVRLQTFVDHVTDDSSVAGWPKEGLVVATKKRPITGCPAVEVCTLQDPTTGNCLEKERRRVCR